MRRGFGVVELLIVVGVIGLLSIISMPFLINYQKTTKLQSESRLLATNLRFAQQLAITQQNVFNLVAIPATNSYQITNSSTSELIKTVELDDEVSIVEITDLNNNTVQFTPTGSVIHPGSITLVNSHSETSTVAIKPSGYVEITD
jgi:Tfp pilus assembly protein FimT